jgi:hypothetical protein
MSICQQMTNTFICYIKRTITYTLDDRITWRFFHINKNMDLIMPINTLYPKRPYHYRNYLPLYNRKISSCQNHFHLHHFHQRHLILVQIHKNGLKWWTANNCCLTQKKMLKSISKISLDILINVKKIIKSRKWKKY